MEEQIIQIKCIGCNKEKKLYAKDKCKYCYNKEHQDPEKQKACRRRWREKNPDYYKNYFAKRKEVKNETRIITNTSTV